MTSSLLRLVARRAVSFIGAEGSTRVVGALRMFLVVLLWTRFSGDLILYRATDVYWFIGGLWFFLATPFLFVGLYTRVAAALVAGNVYYLLVVIGAWRGFEPYHHHHVAFLVTEVILLALTPCGRSFSLDRFRAVRRDPRGAPPERAPLWGQRLMALQVSALYFFGAVDKLDAPFLTGARMRHHYVEHFPGFPLPQDSVVVDALFFALGTGTVLLEFALAVGLFVPRLRVPLVVLGVVFHIGIYATLPVSTFSATVIVLYLSYVSPAAFHRFVDEVVGRPRPPVERP